DQPSGFAQAEPRPGAERSPKLCATLLDCPFEALDEASRTGRPGRVAPREMREFMRDNGSKLALREHAKERQADQEGARSTPRHNAATRKISQSNLPWRFDAESPADAVDRGEQ